MNLLLIYILISTIIDYYYENNNTTLKKFKFGLCFLSLIPIIYTLNKILKSPETIFINIIRETFECAFPGFKNRCENYLKEDYYDIYMRFLNEKKKNIYRFFVTSSKNGSPDKIDNIICAINMRHLVKGINIKKFGDLYIYVIVCNSFLYYIFTSKIKLDDKCLNNINKNYDNIYAYKKDFAVEYKKSINKVYDEVELINFKKIKKNNWMKYIYNLVIKLKKNYFDNIVHQLDSHDLFIYLIILLKADKIDTIKSDNLDKISILLNNKFKDPINNMISNIYNYEDILTLNNDFEKDFIKEAATFLNIGPLSIINLIGSDPIHKQYQEIKTSFTKNIENKCLYILSSFEYVNCKIIIDFIIKEFSKLDNLPNNKDVITIKSNDNNIVARVF